MTDNYIYNTKSNLYLSTVAFYNSVLPSVGAMESFFMNNTDF